MLYGVSREVNEEKEIVNRDKSKWNCKRARVDEPGPIIMKQLTNAFYVQFSQLAYS